MEKEIIHKEFGVIVEWWYDKHLGIIRGSGDMSRKTLDHWGDSIIEVVKSFPEPVPIFMEFDLSSPTQGFTPYSRLVIDRIYHSLPFNKPIYVGIFMRESIISRIVSFYINRREGRNLTLRMFFTEAKTLEWLGAMMKHHGILDDSELPT